MFYLAGLLRDGEMGSDKHKSSVGQDVPCQCRLEQASVWAASQEGDSRCTSLTQSCHFSIALDVPRRGLWQCAVRVQNLRLRRARGFNMRGSNVREQERPVASIFCLVLLCSLCVIGRRLAILSKGLM